MENSAVLAELAALADRLGPALEPPGALYQLDDIVETARELLGASAASVAIVDHDEETLEFLVATGPSAEHVVGLRVPLGQGIAGFVAASGQSLTVTDTTQDPRFASDLATDIGYVPGVLLAVPLAGDDEVLGVMEVLDPTLEPDGPTSRLLEVLAQQAALTLQTLVVFTDLGSALLHALAARVERDALTHSATLTQDLRDAAAASSGATADVAELAAAINSLGRLGPDERATATKLLTTFTMYVERMAPQP
jgi:signal transduction protein with GAF and PtsI domain